MIFLTAQCKKDIACMCFPASKRAILNLLCWVEIIKISYKIIVNFVGFEVRYEKSDQGPML